MPESIEVSDHAGVRTIRMNRPEKKNALTQPMYAAMTAALGEAQEAEAIRCIIVGGVPGAFCAGADIGEFLESAQSGALRPNTVAFLKGLARNRKPLVAAVGGLAVGIGVTMLFHCDHIVASREATFTTPFLKLALIPEAASSLLAPLRMGYARAFSMLVMGRPLSAADAKEAGIVNTIVEAAAVEEAALQAARDIAALPAGAVAVSRALMRGFLDDVERQIDSELLQFRERLQSDEARAAFAAFLSRKK
ncbi:MAG TPA: enoyl-CoA hydratase-related protein [Xanthobacteraceae bacterium]|jgi:enoyl-CoA hydratase/carnithine racemase|nr:enoyl-CoA hydratase-related protein [Xanthobacteraceae bacterium]